MNRHVKLFHSIAPFYQLFFRFETVYYSKLISRYMDELNLEEKGKLLDLGSGTGAFAFSWEKAGFSVTAADAAPGMVRQCRKNGLTCLETDILKGLPFEDGAFDVITGAYLAHGLAKEDRSLLYRESSRLARELVIFHDYSKRSNPVITLIEKMEGSHYREFVNAVPGEMEIFFKEIKVLAVDPWHNWYICTPFGI